MVLLLLDRVKLLDQCFDTITTAQIQLQLLQRSYMNSSNNSEEALEILLLFLPSTPQQHQAVPIQEETQAVKEEYEGTEGPTILLQPEPYMTAARKMAAAA